MALGSAISAVTASASQRPNWVGQSTARSLSASSLPGPARYSRRIRARSVPSAGVLGVTPPTFLHPVEIREDVSHETQLRERFLANVTPASEDGSEGRTGR